MASQYDKMIENLKNLSPHNDLRTINSNLPSFHPTIISIPQNFTQTNQPFEFSNIHIKTTVQTQSEPRQVKALTTFYWFDPHFSSSQTYIATVGGNKIFIHQLQPPQRHQSIQTLQNYAVHQIEEDLTAVALGFSQDLYLAAAGSFGLINIINVTQGQFKYQLFGHKNHIQELKFKPNHSQFLLSCSRDLTVRLWNIKSRVQVAIFFGVSGHHQGILTIDWHFSQQVFLSAGFDSALKIWKIDNNLDALMDLSNLWDPKIHMVNRKPCARNPFKTVQVFKEEYSTKNIHKSYIVCARFYGNLVITKAQDGNIVVWKPHNEWLNDSVIVLFVLKYPETFEVYMKFDVNYRNDLLVVGGEGVLYLFQLVGQTVQPIEINLGNRFGQLVSVVGFSEDGWRVIAVDRRSYIYDVQLM